MKGIRYTAEFKAEAIKQITERGHNTADVADRYVYQLKVFTSGLKRRRYKSSQ